MGKTIVVLLALLGLAFVARDIGGGLARGAVFARVLGVEVHLEVRLERAHRLAPPPPSRAGVAPLVEPDTLIVVRTRQ
jgi:hypothetical protein